MASIPPDIRLSYDKNYDETKGILPTYYCTLRFMEYDRPRPFGNANFSNKIRYILPLPQTLNDAVLTTWTGNNLDVVGDFQNLLGRGHSGAPVSSALYRNAGGMISGFGSAAFDMGGAALDKAGMLGGLFDKVREGLEKLVPAEQIQNAIESSVGVAANPNPTLMFKGPELRKFQFRWIFYPKHPDESDTIHKMIQQIKSMMTPATYLTGSASLLSYPYICAINFYPWDNGKTPLGNDPSMGHTTDSIIIIKRCAVTGCSVNYNPGGHAASFFAGTNKPTVIEMVLDLHEMEYLTSGDWGGTIGTHVDTKDLEAKAKEAVSGYNGADAVAPPPDGSKK